MSIDPQRLETQRRVLAIAPAAHRSESRCTSCGRRTTRPDAVCQPCAKAADLLSGLRMLPTDKLVSIVVEARTELKRRQDEISAALKEG